MIEIEKIKLKRSKNHFQKTTRLHLIAILIFQKIKKLKSNRQGGRKI